MVSFLFKIKRLVTGGVLYNEVNNLPAGFINTPPAPSYLTIGIDPFSKCLRP